MHIKLQKIAIRFGGSRLHAYVFAYKHSITKNAADIAMKKYEFQTY